MTSERRVSSWKPGARQCPGPPVQVHNSFIPGRVLTDSEVELVLRQHLPVPLDRSAGVLCLCDMTRSYNGPVGHRLHVVAALREAGMLRD